jgi:NitT/TauT family transport system substrate-binding protein
MGLQFGHLNPAAAAQVVLEQFPALASYLRPEVAVEAVTQLARTYRGPWEQRQGWGWHDPGQWQFLLDLMQRHGQLARRISAEDALTNGFVPGRTRSTTAGWRGTRRRSRRGWGSGERRRDEDPEAATLI